MSCSIPRQSRKGESPLFAQQSKSNRNNRNTVASGMAKLNSPVAGGFTKREMMRSSDMQTSSNSISCRQVHVVPRIATGANKKVKPQSHQLHSKQEDCDSVEKEFGYGNKSPLRRYTGSADDSIKMIDAAYKNVPENLQTSRRGSNQQPYVAKRQILSGNLSISRKSSGSFGRRKSADIGELKRSGADMRDLKRKKSADMRELKRSKSADMKDATLPSHKGYLCYNCMHYGKAARSCREPLKCTADPKPPPRLDFKRKPSIHFDENAEYFSW